MALAVLAQVAGLRHLLGGSYFFTDDFLFARQAQEATFSLRFLRLPLFEHFSPVHRAVNFAFVRLVPFDFSLALLVGLVLLAASVFVFDRLVRLLFGDSWRVFALTVAYGGSLFFVHALRWWTASIHFMPATLLGVICLYAFARWQLGGSRRWLVLSVGAFWFSLLTHEQAMLSLGYLLLVRVLLLGPGASIRSVARAFWAERWAWAAYSVGAAVAVWNFFAFYHFPVPTAPTGVVLRSTWNGFAQGFAPGLLGIKFPEGVLVSTAFTTWLAVAAVAAVCTWSIALGPSAWRAWVAFAAVFLANVVPVALNRVALFGPTIARDPVYQQGVHYFFLLALGFAFHPRFAGRRTRASKKLSAPAPPVAWGLALVGLVVYSAVLARSVDAMFRAQPLARMTKAYVGRFTREVASLRRHGVDPTIFNAKMPESLMPGVFVPYNRQNRFLAVVDPSLRFNETTSPGFRVRRDGSLSPATFTSAARIGVRDAHATGRAGLANARVVDRVGLGPGLCFETKGGASLALAVDAGALARPAFVRIDHRVDGPLLVKVLVDDGRGLAPANANDSVWTPGQRGSFEEIDHAEVRRVVISFRTPGRTVCLDEVVIGRLEERRG